MTSRNPLKRWSNGEGYKTQIFYRAIKKYQWNNIYHIVLASNLSQLEAEELEINLISYLKSNFPKYGYNIASGGMFVGGSSTQVAQYDLCGNFIKAYPSMIKATEEIAPGEDLCSSGIHWALSKPGRSWRNFMWKTFDVEPLLKIDPYIPFDCTVNVLQYDIYGNFIKEWNSLKEASEFYDTYMISNACRKLAPTAVGYQWKYKDDTSCIEDISNNVRNKTVYVYTLDGKFIDKFDSISDAVRKLKININRTCLDISSCYENIRRNSSHGYRWSEKYYEALPPLFGTTSSKIVVQKDGETNKIIDIFCKIKDAVAATSESRPTIINSCKNHTKTKRNFIWSFIEDVTEPKFINKIVKDKYYSYID